MDFTILFEQLSGAWNSGGWLALAGAAIMVGVKVWASPVVQSVIDRRGVPEWLVWDNLTSFGKLGVVFAATALGTALTALATGVSLGAAIGAGLTAALAAVGTNELLKGAKRSTPLGKRLPSTTKKQPSLVHHLDGSTSVQ